MNIASIKSEKTSKCVNKEQNEDVKTGHQKSQNVGSTSKNVNLVEYVWTGVTNSWKQADIIMGWHTHEPGNHKSKTNNRFTKTKKKGTQATTKQIINSQKEKQKEGMNKELQK